jgi:pimeloyl-ACP methyl ester carboxylesterase
MSKPLVILVHGAFADGSSWNAVIHELYLKQIDAVAVANPLRSLAGDAAYLRDVIAAVQRPVVLVGHSYGGLVITEAGSGNDAVQGLVYVNAFVPERGATAFDLSNEFPGGTLGDALISYPLADGSVEFRIANDKFHQQFAADIPLQDAALLARTQRPVTQAALTEGLPSEPAWKQKPSWAVFGDSDLNIPVAEHRAGAERAGVRGHREIAGASHAISLSQPVAVAELIAEAVGSLETADEAAA